MAPSLSSRNADANRNLRRVSFGPLATAVVGCAVALPLSLGVYTPSTSAAELMIGDDATTSSSVLTTLVTKEAGAQIIGVTIRAATRWPPDPQMSSEAESLGHFVQHHNRCWWAAGTEKAEKISRKTKTLSTESDFSIG